jgi:hypothetical protein
MCIVGICLAWYWWVIIGFLILAVLIKSVGGSGGGASVLGFLSCILLGYLLLR